MRKLLLILIFLYSANAAAQQTILNVPSASILEKDRNFFQHESQFKPDGSNQFINVTNYYARGVGNNTELNVTQFNLSSPSSKNTSLAFGGRTSFLLSKSAYKPRIIIGAMLPFSMQGKGVGHWIYSTMNLNLPQSQTRLTAGFSSGSKQIFGKNVNCFIGGVEQRITDKLGFYADWYSGNHAAGLAAFALGYFFNEDWVIYGGYQIANNKRTATNSYIIEIGKYF